jgi:hypothetical protein
MSDVASSAANSNSEIGVDHPALVDGGERPVTSHKLTEASASVPFLGTINDCGAPGPRGRRRPPPSSQRSTPDEDWERAIKRRPAQSPQSQTQADAWEHYSNQVASAFHLRDLKRAGYSPTMTELHIPHDDRLPGIIMRAPITYSATGSQAAMCAEGGERKR